MATKLTPEEIQTHLQTLNDWKYQDEVITRRFELPSFTAALVFVSAVGQLAEGADHHPDMLIQWRNVKISLSTHDAGGITEKDFSLAQQIDSLPLKS